MKNRKRSDQSGTKDYAIASDTVFESGESNSVIRVSLRLTRYCIYKLSDKVAFFGPIRPQN